MEAGSKMNSLIRIYSNKFPEIRTLKTLFFSTSSKTFKELKRGKDINPLKEEMNNEPINFFGSNAASWKAKSSRSGGAEDVLWYQPYVISGSLAIFILYFGLLREENDIDAKLGGSLFDHIQGLEEAQLISIYKYNKENGLDVSDIEKRLKELGKDITQLQ